MFATEIAECTLIGVGNGERPQERGNCFSVKCDDGKYYRIVNFNMENLEALFELGLKWPIECKAIGERTALIHDGRIGERWYSNRYCEICCPRTLLPSIQIDIHERDIKRGVRKEFEGFTQHNFGIKSEFE